MKQGLIALAGFALALPALCGCGETSVKRMDASDVKDISGHWNDTDSRMVAEEMISDCLSRPWLANFGSKQPTVIVGTVRNKSAEHISTDTFVEDLQRALINSNKVNFVASKGERGDVRDERLDQDTNADEDSRKAHGKETGADFMLSGTISQITDSENGKVVVLYQTNLKLLDMTTNRIAWNGEKKIKKFVQRAKAGW